MPDLISLVRRHADEHGLAKRENKQAQSELNVLYDELTDSLWDGLSRDQQKILDDCYDDDGVVGGIPCSKKRIWLLKAAIAIKSLTPDGKHRVRHATGRGELKNRLDKAVKQWKQKDTARSTAAMNLALGELTAWDHVDQLKREAIADNDAIMWKTFRIEEATEKQGTIEDRAAAAPFQLPPRSVSTVQGRRARQKFMEERKKEKQPRSQIPEKRKPLQLSLLRF